MTHWRERIVIVVMLTAASCQIAKADSNSDAESAQCLNRGTFVIIEDLDTIAQSYGLSKDELKTSVELKLLKNGVKVEPIDNAQKSTYQPFLHVTITTVKPLEPSHVAINLQVELSDMVVPLAKIFKFYKPGSDVMQVDARELLKDRRYAPVWSKEIVGDYGKNKLPNAIYEEVDRYMDSLVHDYLLGKQNEQKK